MKVLYISGSCLTRNTSANMSHNAFVKGLLDNNAEIDIIMAKESWGAADTALPKFENITYYEFNSVSWIDKLRVKMRDSAIHSQTENQQNTSQEDKADCTRIPVKAKLRQCIKNLFYFLFPNDPLYPLEKEWLKTSRKFQSAKQYDLIISNSSPAASHNLAEYLLRREKVKADKWIQIWEDPWYFDLYGGKDIRIKEEEHRLLKSAEEVYYVSPLTLKYQQKTFPDCASKMKCVPLPFLEFEDKDSELTSTDKLTFGYFGDYFSQTRNLKPFYEALYETPYAGYIYGDSDLSLKPTKDIEVNGRVTLDILKTIQDKTTVLVHLCNLRGGQIPGKIYHYSATDKKIIFILDGTEEEKDLLRKFFNPFNRYYFCENNKSDILNTIKLIESDKNIINNKVDAFSPLVVVRMLIEGKTVKL